MTEPRLSWYCPRCRTWFHWIDHPGKTGVIRNTFCRKCKKEARQERNRRYYKSHKHTLRLRRLEGKQQASRRPEASDAEAN